MALCNLTHISELGTTEAEGRNEHIKSHDDATWILTSAFIIFTMQSGFGLLESGSVSVKNEVNIMVKNAVDVIFGGLTYWMLGYGISFGDAKPYSNPFCGWGSFFVTASEEDLGWVYAQFFFQASFATTATTIVSGSMAERTKLEAYIIFSMLNTFIFSFPAHWIWSSNGWLRTMGVVDIAGAGPVHIVGGMTGLVATVMLKPRHNRFETKDAPPMGSPTNAILGMFMLWWGWLGFNCGSTFGISGLKWKLAARSAVATVCSSIAGGVVGLMLSYIVKNRKFDVSYMINGVLGSLVGITSMCALAQPWQGLVIGSIGALVTNGAVALLDKLHIDDPVGCVGTHAFSGIWSLLAAGIFIKKDTLAGAIQLGSVGDGLIHTGNFKQLGVQCLAVVSISAWTILISILFLKLIDIFLGIRVPIEEEILGADVVEHSVAGIIYDKKKKKIVYIPRFKDISPRNTLEKLFQHPLVPGERKQSLCRRHSLGYHPVEENEDLRNLAPYADMDSINTNTDRECRLSTIFCYPCVNNCCGCFNRIIPKTNSYTAEQRYRAPINDTNIQCNENSNTEIVSKLSDRKRNRGSGINSQHSYCNGSAGCGPSPPLSNAHVDFGLTAPHTDSNGHMDTTCRYPYYDEHIGHILHSNRHPSGHVNLEISGQGQKRINMISDKVSSESISHNKHFSQTSIVTYL